MNKGLIATVVILAACIIAAAAFLLPAEPAPVPSLATVETPTLNPGAAIEDRVAALEDALARETEARRALQEELAGLYSDLDKLRNGTPAAQQGAVTDEPLPPRPPRPREEPSFEERKQALVDQGLAPERAAFILQRESELRFALTQAYYEAKNSGKSDAPAPTATDTDQPLLAEIGEDDFEKYLRANNRSTSVHVEDVLRSSAAAKAGLRPGDEIVRYAGDRVFNSSDLINRVVKGDGKVVVEVVRNGTTMELVLPSGYMGIEFGRRS
jgi:hypothetical protein